MNGPHRSPAPMGPGPLVSPGPPFPISDRPPSHTGPLPPLPDDRPPSLSGHPRPLSDIPRCLIFIAFRFVVDKIK